MDNPELIKIPIAITEIINKETGNPVVKITDNPVVKTTDNSISGYYTFNRYHCKNCDKTLSLDLWQMKQLPWSMAKGCKGRK